MRKHLLVVIGGTGLLVVLASVSAWAHHAFSAEYDTSKPLKLQGTVKKVEWINPHSWITIDVKAADGSVDTWEIEAGSPNSLFRRGFNRGSLPVGTVVVINGYQSRDGGKRANGGDITFADGKRLFLSGSNPDDPQNKKK